MIDKNDNRSVGIRLKAMLESDRVLDFTSYLDGPFTPLDSVVPVYESADTYWVHIR